MAHAWASASLRFRHSERLSGARSSDEKIPDCSAYPNNARGRVPCSSSETKLLCGAGNCTPCDRRCGPGSRCAGSVRDPMHMDCEAIQVSEERAISSVFDQSACEAPNSALRKPPVRERGSPLREQALRASFGCSLYLPLTIVESINATSLTVKEFARVGQVFSKCAQWFQIWLVGLHKAPPGSRALIMTTLTRPCHDPAYVAALIPGP